MLHSDKREQNKSYLYLLSMNNKTVIKNRKTFNKEKIVLGKIGVEDFHDKRRKFKQIEIFSRFLCVHSDLRVKI